jgi:hypothetical protein
MTSISPHLGTPLQNAGGVLVSAVRKFMSSFENWGAPGVVVRVAYLNEDCEGGVIFVPWGIGILDCLARRASSLDRMTDQPTDRPTSNGSGFRDRRGAEGSVIGRAERRRARATAVQGTSEC